MVDQILKTLLQQRIMAAKEFLGFCPVGSYYDYNGQICIVTGYDDKTGFLNLQPTGGTSSIIVHPDPISIMFPNAVPNQATAAATALPTGAGIGSTLLSAGPMAASAIPSLLALKSKGAAKAAASNRSGMNIVDAMQLPNQPAGLTLVNNPGALVTTAKQNLDGVSASIDKLLNYGNTTTINGVAVPQDLFTYSTMDPSNAFDIATANAKQQYLDGLQGLKDQIARLDQDIGNIPTLQSPDMSDPLGLNQSSNIFGSSNTPFSATDTPTFSPDNLARVNALVDKRASLQTQLDHAMAPDAQDNYVAKKLTDWNVSVSQLDPARQAYQQAQTYSDAIHETLQQPFTSGEYKLAALELQKQGMQFQMDPNGNPYSVDSATKNALDKQILVNRKNALSDYSVEDATPNADGTSKLSQGMDNYFKNGADQQAAILKKQMMRGAEIKFGTELALAAAAAYGEERAIDSMFHNGFSFKAFLGAAVSAVGLFGLLHSINGMLTQGSFAMQFLTNHLKFLSLGTHFGSFLKFISGGWGFLALQAAIIFFGWLFGHKKTPPEQAAAEQLNAEVNPMVWNPNGQVIFLTAGLTMATMGLNLSPSAPMMQTLTLTQAQATQALVNAGAGGVPTDTTRYADVFVQQGSKGQPTRVVYLTPAGTDSKGNVIEKVTVQTLNQNFQFATSQPPTGYVPFFINGPNGAPVPNPQVVQSLSNQQHLLLCADGTWVTDASKCVAAAGTASHSGGS